MGWARAGKRGEQSHVAEIRKISSLARETNSLAGALSPGRWGGRSRPSGCAPPRCTRCAAPPEDLFQSGRRPSPARIADWPRVGSVDSAEFPGLEAAQQPAISAHKWGAGRAQWPSCGRRSKPSPCSTLCTLTGPVTRPPPWLKNCHAACCSCVLRNQMRSLWAGRTTHRNFKGPQLCATQPNLHDATFISVD